ncbi:MAG: alpha/beta hydrolase [Bifidobacteriaceae bacterium]|jgi:pimeloyl-ACP methyl ester carboxylesterase|nr:alpha/beta hydrolase [Bifidobacteriaceae bacterium]
MTISTQAYPGPRPVLLIHGLGASGRLNWLDTGVVAALAAAGRGALVVGLPGHPGGPQVARGEVSLPSLVADLAEAVRESGQDQADVFAHSLGARIAWELAGAGVVRRAVLDALAPLDPFARLDIAALESVIAGAAAPDPLIGMFAQLVQGPGLHTASAVALIEGVGASPFDPAAANRPSVPVLLVAGADDAMARGADQIAAGLPQGDFISVPGDHEGALASPQYARAAIAFVTRP